MKPNYYKPTLIRRKYGAVFNHAGDEINEKERGLDEGCASGDKHEWLVLPFEQGQKEYLQCLKCGEYSHF